MTDEEKTREQIEEIVNNNNEETVNEEIKEEIKEEVKPKAKSKPRAKAKIKIVKEPVVEEPVVEEVSQPVVEEKPKKIDRYKELVRCPDCLLSMTQHTLKYIHKRRGFCKAVVKADEPEQTPEPIVQQNLSQSQMKL